MSKIAQVFRRHPLIGFLIDLKGNPKVCTLIEPLWGIPYFLIAPFVTLYMVALGVTDIQIGVLLSVSMVVQVVFSFSGGIIADKLGRQTTTILGDILGWAIPCIVWAVSQNFWFFLIAMLLNSFEQVNQTAWQCLLIEDADQKDLVNIYTWIMISALLSVFFAPISGVLIGKYSLVPVVRVLYMCFCALVLLKCWITYRYMTETKQGLIRKADTKNVPVWKLVYEYKHLVPKIFKSKTTVHTLIIMVLLFIANMISSTFFGLYANTRLGISERYLAFFPILKAGVMLVFLFGIQHLLTRFKLKVPMQVGFLLYILCQFLLIFSPSGSILTIVVYILLDAVANSLIMPRKESLIALSIDPKERARIMALLVSFTTAFSSPFGALTGWLSSVDRRLPFVFAIALYAAAIPVLARWSPLPETEAE